MDDSKETVFQTQQHCYTKDLRETLEACIRPIWVQARWSPRTRTGQGRLNGVPYLTEKLSATDIHWQREKLVFSKIVSVITSMSL